MPVKGLIYHSPKSKSSSESSSFIQFRRQFDLAVFPNRDTQKVGPAADAAILGIFLPITGGPINECFVLLAAHCAIVGNFHSSPVDSPPLRFDKIEIRSIGIAQMKITAGFSFFGFVGEMNAVEMHFRLGDLLDHETNGDLRTGRNGFA